MRSSTCFLFCISYREERQGCQLILLALADSLKHLLSNAVPLWTALHNLNSKLHFTYCGVFLAAHRTLLGLF
jgi:hypothetical protein